MPKRKKGKYKYIMLAPHTDPGVATFEGWSAGSFDTDEAAFMANRDKWKLQPESVLVRVIGKTSTEMDFIRYE